MTHPIFMMLPTPLSNASPYAIERALSQVKDELESCATGQWPDVDESARLDRLEAFALLSHQHLVNTLLSQEPKP